MSGIDAKLKKLGGSVIMLCTTALCAFKRVLTRVISKDGLLSRQRFRFQSQDMYSLVHSKLLEQKQ